MRRVLLVFLLLALASPAARAYIGLGYSLDYQAGTRLLGDQFQGEVFDQGQLVNNPRRWGLLTHHLQVIDTTGTIFAALLGATRVVGANLAAQQEAERKAKEHPGTVQTGTATYEVPEPAVGSFDTFDLWFGTHDGTLTYAAPDGEKTRDGAEITHAGIAINRGLDSWAPIDDLVSIGLSLGMKFAYFWNDGHGSFFQYNLLNLGVGVGITPIEHLSINVLGTADVILGLWSLLSKDRLNKPAPDGCLSLRVAYTIKEKILVFGQGSYAHVMYGDNHEFRAGDRLATVGVGAAYLFETDDDD